MVTGQVCFSCQRPEPSGGRIRPRITCEDGATVSIQASCRSYAGPRECGLAGYSEVEAGYPSVPPPISWMEFCEKPEHPTGTVYGYLPARLVWEFVCEHGGLAEGDLSFISGAEDQA